MAIHTIVHFEIPVQDPARARHFYQQLFDWEFPESGVPNYWLFNTDGSGVIGDAALSGALIAQQEPYQGPLIYIGVDSVEAYQAKVETLGGQIVSARSPVPRMGWYAICRDTEGNQFALWERDEAAL